MKGVGGGKRVGGDCDVCIEFKPTLELFSHGTFCSRIFRRNMSSFFLSSIMPMQLSRCFVENLAWVITRGDIRMIHAGMLESLMMSKIFTRSFEHSSLDEVDTWPSCGKMHLMQVLMVTQNKNLDRG